MKNTKTRIYANYGKYGLDIYLDISGINYYLTTRRSNMLLYHWLKNGKSIGELSRIRPHKSKIEQKKYHYAQSLLSLAENYFKYANVS